MNPPTVRRVPKSYSHDADEEMFVLMKKPNVNEGRESFNHFRLDLVRHPSYATRYRTFRERNPGDTSPQRRTATIVRRVPEAAIVEGKEKSYRKVLSSSIQSIPFSSPISCLNLNTKSTHNNTKKRHT